MRKKRIWYWILGLILALLLCMCEGCIKEMATKKTELTELYVYAPSDMEEAFERAAELSSIYKIVMTDDLSKANIIVEMDKEFDPEYTEIAYTPFVVVYSEVDENISNMLEKSVLQNALFDENYKEINFGKVIEEVLGEGKWENLGVENMGNIKVYYPAPETPYYSDYYEFMLVTANEGLYPENTTDLKKAMEQIECFEKSKYTEAVVDFDEKVNRTGGFMENTFFLMPEKLAGDLAYGKSLNGRLFYPTTTVYSKYYLKADELGMKLVEVFDMPGTFLGNFYDYIAGQDYRNSWENNLNGITDYLDDERDVYNIIHLDKSRIRPNALEKIEEATPTNTQKEEKQPIG